ncbi:MAG: hypothetical protein Q7I97_07205 [Thermovirgaceae bacterium]|nr:hypothetical protein [Thermovirgaceae bacterium]
MVLRLLTRGIKGAPLYLIVSGFVVLLAGLAVPLLRWAGLAMLFLGVFSHLWACNRRKACNFCGARIKLDAESCPHCGKWVAPCDQVFQSPKTPDNGRQVP